MMQNNKSLGQHWLKERSILEAIAELARYSDTDTCLEIGPGLGTLTASLLRRFRRVVAVEFDEKLARNLPASFPGKNLEVIHADILNYDFSELRSPYVVAGNIPYYITSPIIDRLLAVEPAPQQIVLLVQKEVAERLVARPARHNLLSLTSSNRAEISLGPLVERSYFTPPPKVDSQVVVLRPYVTNPELVGERKLVEGRYLVAPSALALAKIGFSAPRKKLLGNLTRGLNQSRDQLASILSDCSISLDARPAELSLADWDRLAQHILLN